MCLYQGCYYSTALIISLIWSCQITKRTISSLYIGQHRGLTISHELACGGWTCYKWSKHSLYDILSLSGGAFGTILMFNVHIIEAFSLYILWPSGKEKISYHSLCPIWSKIELSEDNKKVPQTSYIYRPAAGGKISAWLQQIFGHDLLSFTLL